MCTYKTATTAHSVSHSLLCMVKKETAQIVKKDTHKKDTHIEVLSHSISDLQSEVLWRFY